MSAINIGLPFNLGAQVALDNRTVVANIATRDALVTGNRVYQGLIVYVTDQNKYFYYNGTSWIELNISGGGGTVTLPSDILFTTGTQTITSPKNFTARPTLSGLNLITTGDLVNLELNIEELNNIVYTTGNQNITGLKTFNERIVSPEIRGLGLGGSFRKIDLNSGHLYSNTAIALDYFQRILSGSWRFNLRPTVSGTGVILNGEAVASNGTINHMIRLTQSEYNAVSPKDPATFYVIVG
jgi:hypothetical protein